MKCVCVFELRPAPASVVATRCGWNASLDFTAAADITPEGFVVKQLMIGTSSEVPLLTPHALAWSLSTSAQGEKLAQRLPYAAVEKRFKNSTDACRLSSSHGRGSTLAARLRWLMTPCGAHARRSTLENTIQDFVTSAIRPRPVAQLGGGTSS